MHITMKRSVLCIMLVLAPVFPAIGDELADRLPADTLVYMGWPGIDRFGEACEGTALDKTIGEAEVARFREAVLETLWPGLKAAMQEEMSDSEARMLDRALEMINGVWHHPTAVGVIGGPMPGRGIPLDVVQIIRPGDDADAVCRTLDQLGRMVADELGLSIDEVSAADATLKQMVLPQLPGLPIRWGAVGGDAVVTLGTQYWDWLEAGAADTLANNERFIAAAKIIKASPDTPMTFVDIHAMLVALEQVQPMFTSMRLPVIGEEDGVKTLTDKLGLAAMQSLSVVIAPEGDGFRTTTLLHAPDMSKGIGKILTQKPLTEDDLRVIPRDVSFAFAGNADLKGGMATFMSTMRDIDVGWYNVVAAGLGAFQMMTKLSLQFDLLGSFGDTWAVYDAPEFGGFVLTGLVIVAEPDPKHSFNDLVAKVLALVRQHADVEIMIEEETYRDVTLRYLDFGEVFSPVSPSWAEVNGRLVITLYPQIARPAIDQILEGKTSLLDNPDFVRCRKHLPDGGQAVMYADTVRGLNALYPLAMPLVQFGVAAARTELGVAVPPTVVPSLPALTKHLYGNAGTIVSTDDGLMLVSHGALPFSVPALGEGAVLVPTLTAILLPPLARARAAARRTVSAANLGIIGRAMYMYAADHDDQFPPDLETLLDQGLITKGGLVAPSDNQRPAPGSNEFYSSYVYMAGFDGGDDSNLMIAYERPELGDGEGVNALFLDGHVQWLPRLQFRQEREKSRKYLEAKSGDDGSGADTESEDSGEHVISG